MKTKITELFGHPTRIGKAVDWRATVKAQHCPYLGNTCIKVRKSQPDISIGTCTVVYGETDTIICPHRLPERRQVFTDCIHLLGLHEPGNELHVVGEMSVPGGNVDYFLVSARNRKVIDFVGIEFQTLDTTGTVWPERQRFVASMGISVPGAERESPKTFGMNWKMTAKTTLVQLHHKIETFEHISKHLVLVIQDNFFAYMRKEFSFAHLHNPALIGDPMHIHGYRLVERKADYRLVLQERFSTDTAGIATCLGLQASAKVELAVIVAAIEKKLSDRTVFSI